MRRLVRRLILPAFLALASLFSISASAQQDYVEGEVVVGFRSTADDLQIAAFENRNGLAKLKVFAHIRAASYRVPPNQTTIEAIAVLSREPIVEYAEPNWILKRTALPGDPRFADQWYLDNAGQVVNGLAGNSGVDINWLAANDLFSGTQDIVVAVVDTGVAVDHPELAGAMWVNPRETLDATDQDGNGYVDDLYGWDFVDDDNQPLDENGHGTLVASLIAARGGNSEGGVGISPRVKVMPLRAGNDLNSLSTTAIISAFTYAGNNGARIINASFGGPFYSASQYATIQWLATRGVLLVAAAGNGGSDQIGDNNDIAPTYPASYALDNVISVAAVDQDGRLTTFSNYGKSSVHIAAPGANIFGASPRFSTVFSAGFEIGAAGWNVGQMPGSRSPYNWSVFVDGFGRHWLTDSVNASGAATNYVADTDSYARTPLITLGIAQLLTYRIWNQLEYGYDGIVVEASSDAGASWTLIDLVTGFARGSCPSCSLSSGSVRYVDLSRFGLQNKNIYIRFRLVSDESSNYDGAYLDEIKINQVVQFSYDGTQYQFGDGTSFSAPIVAGVAALVWSQRPDLTYKQVRDAVLNSAKKLTALQGRVPSGGMVDAYAALQSVIAVPGTSTPGSGIVPVYRFYKPSADVFFFTASEAEKNTIIANYPWYQFNGIAFYAYDGPGSGRVPVYRFYKPSTDVFFFTASEAEKNTIVSNYPWYQLNGIAYYAMPSAGAGLLPVYRFYKPSADVFLFTASEAEKDSIIANYPWYQLNGVGFYAVSQP